MIRVPSIGEIPDRTHPLARGLKNAWVANTGSHRPKMLFQEWEASQTVGDAPAHAITTHGGAVRFDGTNDYLQWDNSGVSGTTDITLIAGIANWDNGLDDDYMVSHGGSSSGNPILSLRSGTSGAAKVFIRDDAGTGLNITAVSSSFDLNDGGYHQFGLTLDTSAGDAILYGDGQNEGSGNASFGAITLNRTTFGALGRSSISNYAGVDILYYYEWDRLLDPDEVLSLYIDPYQFFTSREQVLIFDASHGVSGVDYVSAAAGNWTDPTKWTPNGIPGDGDTVDISHAITIPTGAAVTVGHSPASGNAKQAILVSAGGSLTQDVNSELVCRGDFFTAGGGNWNMNAGAVFEWDSSQATDPTNQNYEGRIGNANNDGGLATLTGTSTNRCTVRSNSSGGNGFWTANGKIECGNVVADYVDFLRIGGSSTIAWRGPMLNSGDQMRFRNCTFDTCGEIRSWWDWHVASHWQVNDCHFDNSAQADRCLVTSGAGTLTTGTREILRSSFDKELNLAKMADVTIQDCVIEDRVTNATETGTLLDGCFILSDDENTCTASTISNNYLFISSAKASNPHFFTTAPDINQTFSGNVLEYGGTDDQGDGFKIEASAGSTQTATITGNLVIPNASGGASCTLTSALGNTGSSFLVNNNTVGTAIGTGSITRGGIAIAETYNGFANMCTSFRSNLFYSTDDTGGSGVHSFGTPVAGYMTVAGYNGRDTDTTDMYGNITIGTVATTDDSANDVNVDPQFVDATRNLASWDTLNGGAGTAANAIAELRKLNTSGHNSDYTVAKLLAYVKAGFVPQNTALRDAAHDGGDIGAFAVQTEATASEQQKPIEYYLKVFRKRKREPF